MPAALAVSSPCLDSREKFGFSLPENKGDQIPSLFLSYHLLGWKILQCRKLGEVQRFQFGQSCRKQRKRSVADCVAGEPVRSLRAPALCEDSSAPRQLYLDLSFRLNLFSHYTAVRIPAHRRLTIGCQESVSWMNALMLWILYWHKKLRLLFQLQAEIVIPTLYTIHLEHCFFLIHQTSPAFRSLFSKPRFWSSTPLSWAVLASFCLDS